MDTVSVLRLVRDGWLASVVPEGLIPGPFLDRRDIDRLAESTGWIGRHLSEAVRRAFSPFDDDALAVMVGASRTHPDTLLAVLAGRLPALGAKVVFHALSAGMDVVLKPSSAEPVFAELLSRSAAAAGSPRRIDLAPRDRGELDSLIRSAHTCLVYGSDSTVAGIVEARTGLPTLTGPHMESIAVVFASSLDSIAAASAVAGAIALDTAIYDQDGCLSPVAAVVQEGGRVGPVKFAELLLDAILSCPLEPGAAAVEDLAAVRLFERESSMTYGNEAVIRGSRGCPPLVVLCDAVRPGPGHRTLQVATFGGPCPDLGVIAPHLRGRMQGMSVAGTPPEQARLFAGNPGFIPNYTCEPGRLQDPPALWLENGIVLCDELGKA